MTDILCIGSVLWDVVGRCQTPLPHGADRPGRISRHPGGVALNIAMALKRHGLSPTLLSAVGQDREGADLIRTCQDMGLNTDLIYRSPEGRTDMYMAIEDPNGLVAALADAHTLEAAGDAILAPLSDGRLSHPEAPYAGGIALDGNLAPAVLEQIAGSDLFRAADLRVAPASPGKALRLLPFTKQSHAVLYANLEEASLLCGTDFNSASEAGSALLERGITRALVTNGPEASCDAQSDGLISLTPPAVIAKRITGAGDCFMAAHIAAEMQGASRDTALSCAVRAAASHVAGETP